MSVFFSLLLLSWFFTKLSIPQGVRDVDSRPPYLRGRENQYDGLVPRTPMNMETAVTVVGKFAVAEAKAQGRPTTRSPTPPTPSEEEIKRHLNTPPRDKSLFWSGPPEGPPYQEPATELAHANGFKVLGDLWKDDDPLYPDRFSKKPGFWKDASAAMAQKTSGVANVVLPEDSEPHPASVWTTTERPALEENNDVTEIVKWTLEGGQGEVIHRAGALTLFFSVFSPQFLLSDLDGCAYSQGIPDPSNSKLKAPSISAPAVDKSAAKHSQPEGSKVLNPLNPDKSRKRVQSEISTHTTTSGKAQVPLPETTGSTNDQSGRKRKARKTAKGKGAEYNKEVIHQAGAFAFFSFFVFVFVFPSSYPLPLSGGLCSQYMSLFYLSSFS